ncbi:rod shape-determining protein MreC [Microbispora sp. SCL1-1]|uniref:rod shape-determining protein MreC n=1 Tax=unclassified Microbispora TaxID=2614687 RepID=UPI001156CD08|nr:MULTISPECIES: rod shape-determining protein MreC [unclassified Microbispora]NJP23766.1 rod shape-determining protein MreC [Microbispora sp. CL1-1]TQS15969.1 rod shape-determining protein MreC [Microbispora sp. SCL1-1]
MRDTRRARLTLGILLAVALILITVDHRAGNNRVLGPVRDFASAVFGKAERVGAAVTSPITGFVGMVRDAPSARRTIADLRKENARLRDEVSAQKLDRARADKLDSMLGLAGLGRYRIVPAQVVARRTVAGFEDTVEIDAGTGDGIRPDMTVLSDAGLVGRVVQAGPDGSTVALLTDPALSAGARLEGGNELGVVSGLGEAGGGGNLVRFRLLDSTVPIGVGRRIVSFGSQQSKPYVPGVPIGVVERVDNTPGEVTRTAYARPFTDFSALDVVGVVVAAPKRDPRDAVLPPKPPPPPKPPREDQRRGDARGQGRASLEAEWGLDGRSRGAGDEARAATGPQVREGRPEAAQERRGRHGTQAVDSEQRAQEQRAQEQYAQERQAQEQRREQPAQERQAQGRQVHEQPAAHRSPAAHRPPAVEPRDAPRQHDGHGERN